MPILDMPLKELKKYQGINPCPDDFDAYWDSALEEIKNIEPEIEVKKAGFETECADCYDLYFTGTNRARIHAKFLKPKKIVAQHPAVLMFHGYSMNSGDWTDKLSFTATGFSVFALDCRGQGGLSEDPGGVKGNTLQGHIIRGLDDTPENLYYRHVFLDTVQLMKIACSMDDIDPARIGTIGASQGGGLSLACAALNPEIKKCVSVYPFLSDYKRVWEMDLAENAYVELKLYFRQFDPVHRREQDVFKTLGYIDIKNLSSRIKGDVLLATALLDETCPPSTQFAAYNKINSKKQMILYPDFKHEWLPGFNDTAFQFLSGL